MANANSDIDIPRLFADLGVSADDLQRVASLAIPSSVRVSSVSPIKAGTVESVLGIMSPGQNFDVIGVKASSGIGEQPLGQTTIDGALNRLNNGMRLREQIAPGESDAAAWFSIENGLFREPLQASAKVKGGNHGVALFSEGADLSTVFDPDAEYADRAVVAIRIPDHPRIVQISPKSEAVGFPKSAVLAAYNADGGFAEHTAGSKLEEMGIVQDKQNPHLELTADRPGGPLPRQDQMSRVMIRALLRLTRQ